MKKIEELKRRPGWPYIDDYDNKLKKLRLVCESYRNTFIVRANTFESKAPQMCNRLEKILMRKRSATLHLCKLAVDFNRLPGIDMNKRALAKFVKSCIDSSRKLEDEILQAIDESYSR